MRFRCERFSKLVCITLLSLPFMFSSTSFAQAKRAAENEVLKQSGLEEIRKKGFAFLQAGDWDSASSTFEKALEIEPRDGLSLYGKALALFNLKEIQGAESKLQTVFEILSPTKENIQLLADSLVLSAVISAVENKNSEAIEKLERAIKLVPNHFDANLSLGRAYFGNGDLERSISAFRRAVSIQSSNIRARFFLATALERVGNYHDAMIEYRAILRLDPMSAEGNLGLGVLLLKVDGDASAEGLNVLQRAVTLNDQLYEGQITLGKVLVRLNRAADAIEHLKKAAELAPNNPEPHYQLSIAYRKLSKRTEADAEAEIVKRIHENRRNTTIQKPITPEQ